jgi:hypothetical protein
LKKDSTMMRLAIVGLIAGAAAFAAEVSTTPGQVTFDKDVLPILQKNCQNCHRPGQIAPMSFLTYASTRPWAKAMKSAVATRKMPPWFADPQSGHWMNDRTLKQVDIDMIVKWADNGAPEGNPKDAPQAVDWPKDGWDIQPDYVVHGMDFKVPAHPKNDVVEWTTYVVPTGFTKDTWITSLEVKPSEKQVTHHICISFVEHDPAVTYNDPKWIDKNRDESGSELPRAKGVPNRIPQAGRGRAIGGGGFDACYVPGLPALDYSTWDAGKLIPAGTDISIQVHYTPNGTDLVDKPEVGMRIAQEPPRNRFLNVNISAPNDAELFAIPPNDGNWPSPSAQVEFLTDVKMAFMQPHMHLRGKDMTYTLVYPDGKKEVVLNVPHYDFNWQLAYEPAVPIDMPKGTKLIVNAHYDNSANNKFNPDPNRTVYYGNMTWEEMMAPFFGVIVPGNVDPKTVLKRQNGTTQVDGA